MKSQRIQKHIVFLSLLIFSVVVLTGSAFAMKFDLGEDSVLNMDTQLIYGAGWRVKDAEKSKLGKYNPAAANTDDGNANFDKWDMINNKVSAIMDIELKYKKFGVFIRPKAFYDRVYMTDNANDSPGTNNNLIAGKISKTDEFADKTEDAHGAAIKLLDLFAYAQFNVADRKVDLRVGRQVISWGESLLIQGGISSAQNYLDLTAAVSPGVELKELFMPTESVYVQTGITKNTNLSAYYQWKWHKSLLPESGSFFSTADMLDKAGYVILHPLIPTGLRRGQDDRAKDSGQYGVRFMYVAEKLRSAEFGLYYINYHEKLPQLALSIPTYHLKYAEDVKLYGASFSSVVGDTNYSGEISYRTDYPIALKTGAMEDGEVVQAQVSWISMFAGVPFIDSLSFMGEVGANQVVGIGENRLAKDKFAWGYTFTLQPSWIQIIPKLDANIALSYTDNVTGNSSYGQFTKNSNSGAIGVNFTYDVVYLIGIKYTENFNPKRNGSSDRDNLTVTLKYTF